MRKVLYKKFIPKQWGDDKKMVEGTNCWEPEFINSGVFHQWGLCMEYTGENSGTWSVALVENSDGTMEEVLPSNLKFIDNQ